MMRLVYLSAPYTTGPDKPAKRQADIDKATAWLMKNSGVFVFSPITYEKPLKEIYGENMDWEFWKPKDEEMVSRCDELWVLCLRNWQNSKGVKFEIELAKSLGKPIRYIHVKESTRVCMTCGGSGDILVLIPVLAGRTSCPDCENGRQWTGELTLFIEAATVFGHGLVPLGTV